MLPVQKLDITFGLSSLKNMCKNKIKSNKLGTVNA